MSHSVGQVAGFAGVTVRTLHHYDEIGLLVPGDRTAVGHRRYTDADLDRLQQILFYRNSASRWSRSPRCWTTRQPIRSAICAGSTRC